MLQNLPEDPVGAEFDALPADADAGTRQDMAERYAPYVRALRARHPGLRDATAGAPGGARFAEQTAGKAMVELYNRAQLDVLHRMHLLLAGAPGTDST